MRNVYSRSFKAHNDLDVHPQCPIMISATSKIRSGSFLAVGSKLAMVATFKMAAAGVGLDSNIQALSTELALSHNFIKISKGGFGQTA